MRLNPTESICPSARNGVGSETIGPLNLRLKSCGVSRSAAGLAGMATAGIVCIAVTSAPVLRKSLLFNSELMRYHAPTVLGLLSIHDRESCASKLRPRKAHGFGRSRHSVASLLQEFSISCFIFLSY